MSNINVIYNNKKINNEDNLTPEETSVKPSVSYNSDNDNSLYTLIMHDPDSIYGNRIHWLIVNIPGNNLQNGQTILEYTPEQLRQYLKDQQYIKTRKWNVANTRKNNV